MGAELRRETESQEKCERHHSGSLTDLVTAEETSETPTVPVVLGMGATIVSYTYAVKYSGNISPCVSATTLISRLANAIQCKRPLCDKSVSRPPSAVPIRGPPGMRELSVGLAVVRQPLEQRSQPAANRKPQFVFFRSSPSVPATGSQHHLVISSVSGIVFFGSQCDSRRPFPKAPLQDVS
ncbi:hypothetical protein EYF80_014839 [Liparis tanakae]|uniref:Uncharacterized protein n=1 Tax=Liparis tanakae TaxID=230148 RepID=A0A4Z2IB42_9TELE|nr:hypothetical protein EYF80_014839 [Liparis tanakae]